MASRVTVYVYLKTPTTGSPGLLITPYLTQETNSTLTAAIERGDGVNQFVVPDISLKGRDRTNTVQPYLRQITPTSSTFFVDITQEFNDGSGGRWYEIRPNMMILPNTLVFDEVEKSFAFTAVFVGRNAALTDASSLFKNRQTLISGSIPRWQILVATTPFLNEITVGDMLGLGRSDLYAGDIISIGQGQQGTSADEYQIQAVLPFGTNTYKLRLIEAPKTVFAIGTYVSLMTPYDRNLSLQSVVTTLFAAVPWTNGLQPTGGFNASALPGQSTLFSSPLTVAGLSGEPISFGPYIEAIQPGTFAQTLWAATTTGIYRLSALNGPWTFWGGIVTGDPIRDPTNHRTVLALMGQSRTFTVVSSKKGVNSVMSFYGYLFNFNSGTGFIRYRLEITCNADSNDGLPPYPFTIRLYKQTASLGYGDWGSETLIQNIESGSSSDDLTQLYDCFGIDVDPITGVVVFSDVTQTGATSDPPTYQTSVYVPGAGVTRGRVAGRACPVVTNGAQGQFALLYDSNFGQSPSIMGITVDASGSVSIRGTNGTIPNLIPRTLRWNAGDNRFYALYTSESGLWMRTFETDTGVRYSNTTPDVWVTEDASDLLRGFAEANLSVWRMPGRSGRFPLIAQNGNVPFFIDNSFSGNIAYADMTDLNVGDALQQLSILVGAYVYYDLNAFGYFRSRSAASGTWIGYSQGNSALDGPKAVTIRVQSIWAKNTLYVRVENENNDKIFGEAGDKRYREDSALGLTLACRYVPTSAYAQAVATGMLAYLGASKRWVEIQHVIDGRAYALGNMFTAYVDGMTRTFQIVETQMPLFGTLIKVIGVEL